MTAYLVVWIAYPLLVSFRIDLQILHQTVRKTPDKLIKIETGEPK